MIEWWVAALWSSVFRSWDADLLFLLGHSGREIMIVENTRLHEKREILSILPTTQHKVTTHKVAPLLCFYSLLQQSETSREQGQVCSPCTALMPSFYFFLLCSRCFSPSDLLHTCLPFWLWHLLCTSSALNFQAHLQTGSNTHQLSCRTRWRVERHVPKNYMRLEKVFWEANP